MRNFPAIVLLLYSLLLLQGCGSTVPEKINGVSFVASREAVKTEQVQALEKIAANYAAVMPFGFLRDPATPELIYNTERQWYGETEQGARQYIQELKQAGIRVMLKPQIWIWRGVFTGTLEMKREEEWQQLESHYRSFILDYARVAAETDVALFCVGTELERFTQARPEFWSELIREVREIYPGKLTYAANWDEYPRVPFWKELDYIGVDAYFPLSTERTPAVSALQEAWQPWKKALKETSETYQRPVLFTEYGYRSMDFTAERPWEVSREEQQVNLQAQSNAQQALLEEFWKEDWFAGGFVWKWFIDHETAGGVRDNRFTPQNKPAAEVIRKYYKAY